MTHIKFGVNMSKLCRDTASDAVWHHAIKFINAVNETIMSIDMKLITFP